MINGKAQPDWILYPEKHTPSSEIVVFSEHDANNTLPFTGSVLPSVPVVGLFLAVAGNVIHLDRSQLAQLQAVLVMVLR